MGSVEDKILNVIPLLCSVLKHKGLRAGSEKLLNRGGDAAPSVRSLIAKILEQALTLRNDISGGTQGDYPQHPMSERGSELICF